MDSSESSSIHCVLAVDDNAQNRALVEATLEDEGYRVVLAASGEAALRAFEDQTFDCVLLDVRMPGIDGFDVCRRIRAHERGASTPIVFLTALCDVDTFDAARAAGGDDFLTKPLRTAELLVRVRAALELRRLSKENRGYFSALRDARDALMRLQLQKDQLTAFLVHDLKNPVSTLDMHAQLLLRDKSLTDKSKDSVLAIRQEARRLGLLISNMLDLSKGEAGELGAHRTEVDARALLRALSNEFESRAKSKDVQLRLSAEVEFVSADQELLRRLLENLVDNAIRHAPPASTVSVRLGECEGGVELHVADQGPGVPPELRESIFDRYVQAGGSELRRGGYGLGLAFCKLVAAAHGGTIWVDDAAPGAVFRVRLPRAA